MLQSSLVESREITHQILPLAFLYYSYTAQGAILGGRKVRTAESKVSTERWRSRPPIRRARRQLEQQ